MHRVVDITSRPEPTVTSWSQSTATSRQGEEGKAWFVAEIARRGAIPTRSEAADAARATLAVVGQWLDAQLRADLAAAVPADVGSPLPNTEVDLARGDDVVALYRRVAVDTDTDASLHEVALRCAATLAVLGESLPPALVERLIDQLPDTIGALIALPAPRT